MYADTGTVGGFEGEDVSGYCALVMEKGSNDLKKFFASKRSSLTEGDKMSLGQSICNILMRAHAKGYVLLTLPYLQNYVR